MFAVEIIYSRKMIRFVYTDARNARMIQQPCCIVCGMLSSMRTMSMFMQ